MECQAPALDQTKLGNYNDEGTSGPIVQLPPYRSSHNSLDDYHLEQQPTTRFFSNPSVNHIAYFEGGHDNEHGFGTACGDESEYPLAYKSVEEFWQRPLFQDDLNLESLTPQQREVVEKNSFQKIDHVEVNDGSRMSK